MNQSKVKRTNIRREQNQRKAGHDEGNFHALRIVYRFSNKFNNDLPRLRSLLFQKVKLKLDSWQYCTCERDPLIVKKRWNTIKLIEQFLDMESHPYKCQNELRAIAYVVEYYLFLTAPSLVIYSQHHNLRRRTRIVLKYMAKSIMMVCDMRANSRIQRKIDSDVSPFAEAAWVEEMVTVEKTRFKLLWVAFKQSIFRVELSSSNCVNIKNTYNA